MPPWWILAAAGVFWFLFKNTAPTPALTMKGPQDPSEPEPEIPEEEGDRADQPEGSGEDILEESAPPPPKALPAPVYDPAKNPFRKRRAEGDGFPGSYDDIMGDADPSAGEEEGEGEGELGEDEDEADEEEREEA
ncbi:MAG: hypothetical protein ACREDF_08790 [Thermoplasmata archaeon]